MRHSSAMNLHPPCRPFTSHHDLSAYFGELPFINEVNQRSAITHSQAFTSHVILFVQSTKYCLSQLCK
ncbi:hypothetical protein EJB05_27008, partial [Eragrostis curvula]